MASREFFYGSLVLFVLGCIWIATASLYPMAFDEEFHLGLIRIYATAWLPYGIPHTSDMAQYGAATGDPSYLFHYLMSFPYRMLDGIGLSDWVVIAGLRLINIGFVLAALVVFKKVLDEAKFSPLVSNISLLMLMLIPVFSMLAAQINYDTLLLLIVAIGFLLTGRVTRQALHAKQIPAIWFWALIIVLLVGMSIKYAFLPIAAGFGIWTLGMIVYIWKAGHISAMRQLSRLFHDTFRLRRRTKFILLIGGIVSVFFAAHYGTNVVQYGHPIPDCSAVFDDQACTAYGPWNRNKNYVNNLSDSFAPLSFPAYMAVEWLPGMTERLTFSLAGKTNDFETKQPLPIVLIGFVLLTAIGLFSLLYRLWVTRGSVGAFTWLIIVVTGVYVAVLSVQLYSEYARTGEPVAINGRYLLLVLPVFGAVLLDSTVKVFATVPRRVKLTTLLLLLALLLIGGAGATTYLLQSQTYWFWPGWGQASHQALQAVFKPLIIRWQLFP